MEYAHRSIIDNRNQNQLHKKNSKIYQAIKSFSTEKNIVFSKISFFINSPSKIFWLLFLFFKKIFSVVPLLIIFTIYFSYNFFIQETNLLESLSTSLYDFSLMALGLMVITSFFYAISLVSEKRIF